jgi:hypothetical protein
MTVDRLSQRPLQISCWFFFGILLAVFLAVAGIPGIIVVLFPVAWAWQVFTLYQNRRHFLTWILAILYSIPVAIYSLVVFEEVARKR